MQKVSVKHMVGGDVDKLRQFYERSTQLELDAVAALPLSCPDDLRALIRGLIVKDPKARMDFSKYKVFWVIIS